MFGQSDPGYPWQGRQFNLPTTTPERYGLGRAQRNATMEAATHPGLYAARYDDAVTPQVSIRPALIVPPSELDKWNQLLRTNVQAAGGDV
jgi:hypothetical protein